MGSPEPLLVVEVVYAVADEQVRHTVRLPPGSTMRDAIQASRISQRFPEIDPETCEAGVFGRRRVLGARVKDGDRVEIYRPLRADSKSARRARAGGMRTRLEDR